MIEAEPSDEIDEHGQRWAVVKIRIFGEETILRFPADRPLDEEAPAGQNDTQGPEEV